MDLDRALAFSRYASQALGASPALREEIFAILDTPSDWSADRAALTETTAPGGEGGLAATLRTLRRRVFVHTLCRDLTGRASLGEVMGAGTTLAETAIGGAVTLHARTLSAGHGDALGSESGAPQALIVLAMGKLG